MSDATAFHAISLRSLQDRWLRPHFAETVAKKTRKPIRSRQSLSEKQPGTTLFPMARVKKLIKADRDLDAMSTEATFMIAVATVSCQFLAHIQSE